jgi:glutathione S-transferase
VARGRPGASAPIAERNPKRLERVDLDCNHRRRRVILYYSPGACSLADHIALHEAGLGFERVRVDLKSHRTEDGRDYTQVNPKGYVPALSLDGGEMLTENIAILAWIADQAPQLAPRGKLGRYRLLEALAFISTEVHKSFKPFFTPGATDADKAAAGQRIEQRLGLLAEQLKAGYLFGTEPTVADAYLFVMLTWASRNALSLAEPLTAFVERMKARPAVQLALRHEGLA